MEKAIVAACLPWFAWLALACMFLTMMLAVLDVRLDIERLLHLHREESGAAQSLSFVLVLPVFVMIVLFIVQVSQLMIGTIVVHYAAYATARAAAVWIPANMSDLEGPNRISSYTVENASTSSVNATEENASPTHGGSWHTVQAGSPKYNKITTAAILACMPIAPSRDVGISLSDWGATVVELIESAYGALARKAKDKAMISKRIRHKLAYATAQTTIELRFYHPSSEPPLTTYAFADDVGEFYSNEIGWQDPIAVTVRHNLALLPGPGRLLAKYVAGAGGKEDKISKTINHQNGFYTYPLSASAVIGNEGEKSVIPYAYHEN